MGECRIRSGSGSLADPPTAGREAGISALFDTHHRKMLRLALFLGADRDAEDVVAEAFCQLHQRWDDLRTAEAAVGYLRSTVANLVRMRFRRDRTARQRAATLAAAPEAGRSAEQEALRKEDQRTVVRALGTLPERQREALVLRFWLDLKEPEIAEAMDVSVGAVKSHTFRGMVALRREMNSLN